MHTISVLGSKGGSGKTTVSHILAQGLGEKGYPVMMVQTDVRTSVPPTELNPKRRYLTSGIAHDAPNQAEQLAEIIERTSVFPGSILILDGGANRRRLDQTLSKLSDFVLIPCSTGVEDVQIAQIDLQNLRTHMEANGKKTMVALLRNNWPGDKRRLTAVLSREHIKSFLGATRTTCLSTTVTDMLSVIDLAMDDPKVNNSIRQVCMDLADEVSTILSLPPPPERKAAVSIDHIPQEEGDQPYA